MELELERFDGNVSVNNDELSETRQLCMKLHERYENDQFLHDNWPLILRVTHGRFRYTLDNPEITNAYLKISEIFQQYGFHYPDKIKHFDIACAPGSFILAMKEICKHKNIEYEYKACTLEHGLSLHPSLHGNQNIFFFDILETFAQTDLFHKFNLVTGDVGVQFQYNILEEEQLLALEESQMELSLKLCAEGANVILKMFTYTNEKTIKLVDKFSQHFSKSYVFKPISSRVLNNETYLVGFNYGFYDVQSGTNWPLLREFEKKRQEHRLLMLDSAENIAKMYVNQIKVNRLFSEIIPKDNEQKQPEIDVPQK